MQVELALANHAAAIGRQPQRPRDFALEDGDERVVHSRHQHPAQLMTVLRPIVPGNRCLRRKLFDRVAQRPARTSRLSELLRKIAQHRRPSQVASATFDRYLDHLRVLEVQENGDQISQRFVKREHVRTGRNREARAQAVQERMRCFVSDYVV